MTRPDKSSATGDSTDGSGDHDLSRPGDAAALAALDADRVTTAGRLAGLTGRFEEVVAASLGSNADDEHDPEGATIAFERSQLDALVRQARGHLAEIEAAARRVGAGTYGRCEVCGRPIPADRLAARPVARTCLACAGGRAKR